MRKATFACVALWAVCLSTTCFLGATPSAAYHPAIAKVRYMPQEPLVKVLLTKEQSTIAVSVKGAHTVYDPYTGKRLDSSFLGSTYPVVPMVEGLKWGQEFPGVYQILIVADEPSSGIFINGVPYGGVVALYQVKDHLAAVNWLTVDDFTSALLSSNIMPIETDQKEALAAYAIALRSKVYQQVQSTDNEFYDIVADACQYKGLSFVRTDAPFVDAMRSTKRVTLSLQGARTTTGSSFTQKAIDDVRKQIPIDEAHRLAKEGKDSKKILQKFYPGEMFCMAENRTFISGNFGK